MRNLFLILFVGLFLSVACIPYTIKKYEVKNGEKKLIGYTEYSYNVTPEYIEADVKRDILANVSKQIGPKNQRDSLVYMDQTAALAAMEIGGRYYLASGYGDKRIYSSDGTVVQTVILGNTSNGGDNTYYGLPVENIPEAYWDPVTGKYYLKEDTLKKHPQSPDSAKFWYANPDQRKKFIESW